jgi:hypothetical protein
VVRRQHARPSPAQPDPQHPRRGAQCGRGRWDRRRRDGRRWRWRPVVAAAAGLAAIPGTLNAIIGATRTWKEADTLKWWNELVFGPAPGDEASAEAVAAIIDEHFDMPFVRENVLRSLRTVQECYAREALTPLAVLGRDYLRAEKAPDRFFRGVTGLLKETSGREIREVVDLLEWVLAATRRSKVIVMARHSEKMPPDDRWAEVPWTYRSRRDDPGGADDGDRETKGPEGYIRSQCHPDDGHRILLLLRDNDLARHHIGAYVGTIPLEIEIERDAARSLVELLRLGIPRSGE